MASTLATVSEVRSHVETGLDDDALGRVIDSVDARIIDSMGQHDGDLTVEIETDLLYAVTLPRPAVSVASVEERYMYRTTWAEVSDSTYRMRYGGRRIEREDRPFRSFVRITYTPVDETAKRRQALIDLVRLRCQENGLSQETDGDYNAMSVEYSKEEARILAPLRQRYGGAGWIV